MLTRLNDDNETQQLPTNMNEVNGTKGSNRAFYFENLYKLEETVNLKNFLQYYYAINKSTPNKDAIQTLKGSCSNKCLEIKDNEFCKNVLEEFDLNNGDYKILVGKLKAPYHVELLK